MDLKGYTNIPDWMLSLDLDVYETIILAVIYGFSQDGESTFSGSQNYLAKKARCSRAKVTRAIPKLVSMGLIEKIDKDVRGVKLCEYRVSLTETGCISQIQGGCISGRHNNIENKNIDNNTLYKGGSAFQKPSVEEIRSYCMSRGNNVDPEQFYNFYESKGWMIGKTHMKDWRAAVRTWEQRDREKPKAVRSGSQKESVLEHNLKVMDSLYGTGMHEHIYGKKEVMADEQ